MFKNFAFTPLVYTCIGLALALLLAITWGEYQRQEKLDAETLVGELSRRATSAESALVTANESIRAAKVVNDNAQADLDALVIRLADAIGENQRVQAANEAARAALAASKRDRDRLAAETTRLKEALYATDPTAADWGARPVPPGIADQLQDRWERAAAHGASGAGGQPAGGRPGAPAGGAGSGAPRGAGAAPAAPAGPPGFRGLSDRLPEQPPAR